MRVCVYLYGYGYAQPILLFHIEKLGNSNIDFLRKTDDSKSSVLKRVHRLSAVHEKVWVFRVQKSIREGVKEGKGFDG